MLKQKRTLRSIPHEVLNFWVWLPGEYVFLVFFYGKMIFFKALAGNFGEFLVQKGLAIPEFFEVPGLKSTEFPIEMVVSNIVFFIFTGK